MRVACFIVSAAFIAACGGSVTTVDNNKKASELSTQDQSSLCKDLFSYTRNNLSNEDLGKFACGVSFDSDDDPATCQSKFTACVGRYKDTTPSFASEVDCTYFNRTLAKCDVRVGELADCYKQQIDAMKAVASRFPICDRTELQKLSLELTQKLSAQCTSVILKCQSSLSSGGSSGGEPPPKPDAG